MHHLLVMSGALVSNETCMTCWTMLVHALVEEPSFKEVTACLQVSAAVRKMQEEVERRRQAEEEAKRLEEERIRKVGLWYSSLWHRQQQAKVASK